MDAVTIARSVHVGAVVVWIGGVAFVTLVLLPALNDEEAGARLDVFERLERRFARLAKLSVIAAGVSGFYMIHAMMAWDRFLDLRFWWMHAMLAVWLVFAFVLYVAEPLVLHDRFRRGARESPERSFAILQRMHALLLTLSLAVIAAAVLGAHGALS